MKVALAQIRVTADPDQNMSKVTKAFADSAKSDLLILPELFLSGFRYKEIERFSQLSKNYLAEIQQLCKKHRRGFCGSFLWKKGSGYTNRLYFLNKQGKVDAYYDKSHLIPAFKEDKYLVAGKKSATTRLGSANIGLSICYDLRFPELFRNYARKEVEAIICVAQWPTSRQNHLLLVLLTSFHQVLVVIHGI